MWLYLAAGTVVLAYLFLLNRWQYWKRRGIKGPAPSLLGMGHTAELFSGFGGDEKGINKWHEEFGDMYGIFGFWTTPTLIVSDPDIIKEINVKQFSRFTTRGRSKLNTLFGKLASDFLTIIEGHSWKRQRSTITPFFSGVRLAEMTPILRSTASKIIKDEVSTSIASGEELDTKEFSQLYTMSAIMTAGFSIDAAENEELMKTAVGHGRAFFSANLMRSMLLMIIPDQVRFYFNMTPYPRETDTFFRNLVSSIFESAATARANGQKVRPDFVSLMSENIIEEKQKLTVNKGFTKNEIVSQSFLFILAGFDTTSNVLQFLLYALALNPESQDELYQLIVQVVQDDDATYDHLKKLKLLDAAIKESQRLFTTNPMLGREADENTVVKGIPIDKGVQVFWSIDRIHTNHDFYTDPNTFDPHRFDGQESNTLQDEHWFGFGSGPRACPAVRWTFIAMKIFMVQLLKEYKVVATSKTVKPDEWKMALIGSSLQPTKKLVVGFEKRT